MDKLLEMRNALVAEAETLLGQKDLAGFEAKEKEIKELDNKIDEEKINQANIRSMRNKLDAIKLENQSLVNVKGEKVETMENKLALDERPHDTLEYRNAFLKKLQGKELTKQENTAVSASAVIPTQTINKIFEKAEYIAPILSKVDISYIASNLTIPVEDTVNDASWVAVGTASTDSADSLTSVSLAAYKLIKTVEIGADVAVMSINAFETYLVNKLAAKIAKAIENAIFNGTGSGQPTGLLASGVITNTGTFTKDGMTYGDLLKIISDLPDHGYRAGACMAMPSALFYSDVLPALTDKGSGLDVQAVMQNKVIGYDIVLCDRIAADTIVFGNFKNYALNFAQDVEIKSDTSVGFRTGSTVYRAMALLDGKPVNAAAFNKYTRGA